MELARLSAAFVAQLPVQVRAVEDDMTTWLEAPSDGGRFDNLSHRVHQLKGAGSTFGCPGVSRAARALEQRLGCCRAELDAGRRPEPAAVESAMAELQNQAERARQQSCLSGGEAVRVLVIEDDSAIRDLLRAYFEAKGHIVNAAADGVEGLKAFNAGPADLVLLDIRLPGMDGWAVLEAIRVSSMVPVVLLTALDDTEDVVKGLAKGADDYLTKPFDVRELDARVQAILRRLEAPGTGTRIDVGNIHIDDRSKTVTVGESDLSLSPKEYKLLRLLASEPGRVFSSDEIVAHLWPDSDRAAANDVKQYIHLLRSKLYRSAEVGDPIENIKGFGYRLNG
jgi:DNA-binding response OmpR family regulator